MPKRYVSIWFRHLLTDWKTVRRPDLKGKVFVFAAPNHGRMVVTASTAAAEKFGVQPGMTVADAKVIAPDLQVFDDRPGRNLKLLKGLAEWCLRYTPYIALDPPDGLLLDVTGCADFRGGERAYLEDLAGRLRGLGYDIRPGMADTIGCAWGVARCAQSGLIVPAGGQRNALMPLPPSALRLAPDLLLKLNNLGLYPISSFIHMPKQVLRRRFGKDMVLRLYQALGQEEEFLLPLKEPVPCSERLACLDPVTTRVAIETALQQLLDALCRRLYGEGKGVRAAVFSWYRVDAQSGNIVVGTNHPSQRAEHLFKLFSLKLDTVAPGLGIELFTLEATKTEPAADKQAHLWAGKPAADSGEIAELLDRLAMRIGPGGIHRYLPEEHYWPERNAAPTADMKKKAAATWRQDRLRPLQLLEPPEPVEAMSRVPDYPPKQFIYKGRRHIVVKADGPERIEREWWLEAGEHRDYYIAEDEEGCRYWLFRSGHYDPERPQHWFIHGFFE